MFAEGSGSRLRRVQTLYEETTFGNDESSAAASSEREVPKDPSSDESSAFSMCFTSIVLAMVICGICGYLIPKIILCIGENCDG